MKKVVSLILALVLCLGLCACGGNSDASSNNEALVGQWVSPDDTGFVLLSSGNVVKHASLADAINVSVGITAGTWEVEGEYLIIITENYNVSRNAWVYKITDDHTLEHNGVIYTKAN
jgi:hypothetical protein